MKTSNTQQRIWDNKVNKGFNLTDIDKEFNTLQGEVEELREALETPEDLQHIKEEIADVAIMCYGLSEMIGIDLETAIKEKMRINEKRKYEIGSDGELHKVKL
jgi:NTP pyrophosphatase (non-canonical NTP hydrolase)